ncbi:LytR/AlgR family response regulator transcription factor [Fulvivirga ligni]|uniref:LytR/AlgR family response regulator transcription factor n=1 Tax=Fulvivirga ligni TaxID=2904246 RepID=UPI001F36BFD8|nr:LytTR family DNA-binding domain-containing protein [Fulvivirga ligni]UII20374.1 LytTR family DNA-binding domain-containing protein [Fulvivirga ligni]
MKCMIVEDELPAVKILENHIGHFKDLQISSIHHSAMDALMALQKEQVDILFLDIQLPKISGIQLLHSLKQRPAVILTTAYREFAIEGYELEITDYLLKPISLDRFTRAISKVFKKNEYPLSPILNQELVGSSPFSEPFIYVKSEREYVKILLKDLLYVESIKNHIKLVSTTDTYITLMGISSMEDKLSKNTFMRVHRSFIVSLNHISSFSQTSLHVKNKEIPIGRFYKQQFLNWVQDNIV